jgi:hypothetical protein
MAATRPACSPAPSFAGWPERCPSRWRTPGRVGRTGREVALSLPAEPAPQ